MAVDGSTGVHHRGEADSFDEHANGYHVDRDNSCISRLNVDASQVLELMLVGFNKCSLTATRVTRAFLKIKALDTVKQMKLNTTKALSKGCHMSPTTLGSPHIAIVTTNSGLSTDTENTSSIVDITRPDQHDMPSDIVSLCCPDSTPYHISSDIIIHEVMGSTSVVNPIKQTISNIYGLKYSRIVHAAKHGKRDSTTVTELLFDVPVPEATSQSILGTRKRLLEAGDVFTLAGAWKLPHRMP